MTMLNVLVGAVVVAVLLLAWAVYMSHQSSQDVHRTLTVLPDRIRNIMRPVDNVNQTPSPSLSDQVVEKLMAPVEVMESCQECSGKGTKIHNEPPPLVTAILAAYKRAGIEIPKPPQKIATARSR